MEKIILNSPTREQYEQNRLKYIVQYRQYVRGFFRGHYENRPDIAEAKWKALYPNGFEDYLNDSYVWYVSYKEHKVLADTINQLIDEIELLKNRSLELNNRTND